MTGPVRPGAQTELDAAHDRYESERPGVGAEFVAEVPPGTREAALCGLWRRRAMIVGVGSGEPDAVGGRVARLGKGLVVARPELWRRLGGSARVTVVSAPAGSGKTVLLRTWLAEASLEEYAAWVSVGRDERDPQQFWLSVVAALRRTTPGSALVQPLTAAPELVDGWAIVERLLADLAPLQDQIWLVIDDAHELAPDLALRQLELLVMRAPPRLRFVLAARRDVRLGLHRLRLEGELAEIRADDLRFTATEAAELFEATGVELSEQAVAMLYERTEGWAAGLRLAALAAAGHPDPERFAAGFSGTERTVAEYLLAEVLDRQDERVRRLLLRTSVLEQVNGELAGLLTGDEGAEGVLADLEAANAFVVSLDDGRIWFRYHQLFAGLLRLELRRTEPGEIVGLHRSAAGWLAGNGFPLEAIRHAQAAQDWPLAARLLSDYWPSLHLDGQGATVHAAFAGFPTGLAAADAELAVVAAADELGQGSLEAAEHYLGLAERRSTSVPEARRGQMELLLGVVRLLVNRQRGDLPAVADEARRLAAMAEGGDAAHLGLGEDLHALAMISLGSTEYWAAAPDAERHLERGVALARRVGRPYLEFTGLAHWAAVAVLQSFPRAAELGRDAAELAQRHGWTDDPAFGLAGTILGAVLTWQGRLEEAERWVQGAERTLRAGVEPTGGPALSSVRGALEMVLNRHAEAVTTFQGADRLARRLASPHYLIPQLRALLVQALARHGQTKVALEILAGLSEEDRGRGETRIAEAALRLAEDDPHAATAALTPILDGSAPLHWPNGLGAEAHLLEAIARDALDDQAAAQRALERALDWAEPDGIVMPFLLYPAPDLLERHAQQPTAHASLLGEIRSMLAGETQTTAPAWPQPPVEPLSDSELRVLRYLPTNLRAPEIARELYVSTNTVKTHIRNLYAKLGTHRRAEAVEYARALGLLAPSRANPASAGARLH